MVEHIPLVRVHIARWGTADEGCWLSATNTSKFTSIFVASTTIPARRLLTIGGCGLSRRESAAQMTRAILTKIHANLVGRHYFPIGGGVWSGRRIPTYEPSSASRLLTTVYLRKPSDFERAARGEPARPDELALAP